MANCEEFQCTLIECSNRSPKHSDIYQSLAVAEQYVLYNDLEHSFWKIFTKLYKKKQCRIAPTTFGLITLPKKRKSQCPVFYDTSELQCFFPTCKCAKAVF